MYTAIDRLYSITDMIYVITQRNQEKYDNSYNMSKLQK